MEKKKGKMTLDKLAGMVARGFEKTATKEDISHLEERIGKVEYRVDEVYDILKRFEENDILNLQRRVQVLEKAVRALANK